MTSHAKDPWQQITPPRDGHSDRLVQPTQAVIDYELVALRFLF